jgi:hypothetical protein
MMHGIAFPHRTRELALKLHGACGDTATSPERVHEPRC